MGSASEKELMDALSALSRAVGILEKEMAKNPASFAQLPTADLEGTLSALSTILDAAALSSSDKSTLVALAQTQQSDEDEAPGAPAAATYKTHSTNILDVLEDMKEKAEGQLSDLRKAEVNSRQNYEMLKQSLEDQNAADNKGMNEQKANKGSAEEDKATAEGDLRMTSKELAASTDQLSTCHATCIQVAADHEVTVAGRKEELATIAQARKILTDTSSGAVSQTYSFLELSSFASIKSRADLGGEEVVAVVRKLAKEQHSSALAQLASRISAVARYGAANGDDVFAKIKGLIRDMITKLEKEAGAEASEKAYCDEQIAKTEFKKGELEDDISKMTSRIDKAAARSVQLKAEVKQLQSELGALAKGQAEMDKIRMETHDDYGVAKADLELGLSGVGKALSLLREYYGNSAALLQSDEQQPTVPEKHEKSGGAGGGVINILEVCQADFAKNLAKEESEEADAQSEYYGKIKERCIAKPETYEERKRRREAEIAGLKQALTILKEETALVQRKKHGHFLGSLAA